MTPSSGAHLRPHRGLHARAGAKEVHLRISSPPFRHTCHFGTDIGSEENLIANCLTIPEIQARTGADTLGYISVQGLLEACRGSGLDLCTGCFTGSYATEVEALPAKKKHWAAEDRARLSAPRKGGRFLLSGAAQPP